MTIDNNNSRDIFVHDRDTDEDGEFDEPLDISTVRISVDSDGNQVDGNSFAAAISSDGRFVAFESDATSSLTRTLVFHRKKDKEVFLHVERK